MFTKILVFMVCAYLALVLMRVIDMFRLFKEKKGIILPFDAILFSFFDCLLKPRATIVIGIRLIKNIDHFHNKIKVGQNGLFEINEES